MRSSRVKQEDMGNEVSSLSGVYEGEKEVLCLGAKTEAEKPFNENRCTDLRAGTV